MVNFKQTQLDSVFSALSDATRRAMVERLASGEMTVKDLSEPFRISKPAVTKHLKVLEKAGLLERTVVGREHRCKLNPAPLNSATDWIRYYQKFWEENLDALDAFLKGPL